ncbi:MAG: hypothetical protein R3B06_23230 [Kofleriaceae bacterium]
MRRLVTLVVLVGGLGVAATPSRADRGTWYGWQTLGVDAVADVTMVGGLVEGRHGVAVATVGLAVYALGPPLVHAAHGNWGRGGVSVAMRVGGPLVGGLVGSALCVDRTGFLRCLGSTVIGVVAGAVVAQAVDGAVVAYEDAPSAPVQLVSLGGRF